MENQVALFAPFVQPLKKKNPSAMMQPVLVLQMQRLGDLILTFPLLARLRGIFPGHPVWVVGDEHFFKELMPLSPEAVYFSYEAAPSLLRQKFRAVINCSHRPEALHLTGNILTEERYGPYTDREGAMRLAGAWQLYRASLTYNNRYNLFHWADLNGLELLTPYRLAATRWPEPHPVNPSGSGHVGLFLGASEIEKRPGPEFWAKLAGELLSAGHKPVLLGGEAEKEIAAQVAKTLDAPSLNLAGRFSIRALAEFISNLDLMVTPDTGPMHVAAWAGTPTLNLSMGTVNAWETGPFSPGHHILRARLDCVGCWHCTESYTRCKEHFVPSRIAALIHMMLKNRVEEAESMKLPGLELLRSGRDTYGFYKLASCGEPDSSVSDRMVASHFWKSWFSGALKFLPEEIHAEHSRVFVKNSPSLVEEMNRSLAELFRDLALGVRRKQRTEGISMTSAAFWEIFPPFFRPFSGYIHMLLQNGDFSRSAFARALELSEHLATSLRHSA